MADSRKKYHSWDAGELVAEKSLKEDCPPEYPTYLAGQYELEVTFEGVSDSQKCWERCPKNPGHKKYIPIHDFTIQDLPLSSLSNELMELIQTVSELTVLLKTNYISTDRPPKFPGTEIRYKCYNLRGRNTSISGTGFVASAEIEKTDKRWNKQHCPCQKCLTSPKPKKEWGKVNISTAAHNIYDKTEAVAADCYFNYNASGMELDDCIKLIGVGMDASNDNFDWSKAEFVTHDVDFVYKLQEILGKYYFLRDKLAESNSNDDTENIRPGAPGGVNSGVERLTKDRLVIIVSHPHGYSKHVTVGECVKRELDDDTFTKYFYNTPTCPGSSGALVLVPGRQPWLLYNHLHSGGTKEKDIGMSGLGIDH